MGSIRLDLALQQLRDARAYTLRLLGDFAGDEWYAMPGGVTNAAWQAGHLAMASYRLGLARTRGEKPDDAAILPPEYLTLFGIKSVPQADPTKYPAVTDILATLARVQEAVLRECPTLGEADLDAPVPISHPLFSTKFESLLWCARHEMMHAGQLGLLRRLIGKMPQW